MQFKTLLISSIYAALTTAQQSISDLPACASAGALSAISSSGCATTDIACICRSSSFTSGLTQYAKTHCSPEDYDTAIFVGKSVCAQAGVTVSSQTTSAASSITTIPISAATSTDSATDPASVESATVVADLSVANRTVITTTKCKCEEVTIEVTPTSVPSSVTSSPVSVYTGAAIRRDGGGMGLGVGYAGMFGLLAMIQML